MSQVNYICPTCQATYPTTGLRWHCECGGYFDLDFTLPLGEIPFDDLPTLWRYRPAMALTPEVKPLTLGEGYTPIIDLDWRGRTITVKMELLFPTGSYKDRGAAVMMAQARYLGVDEVVEDSSGNAGCAVAAYAARAGIACHIYVPASTSPGKLSQIESYGAHLHLVPGSREDTARAAEEAARDRFYASHTWNPFFFEGTKTFAYEVWEQTGGSLPHTILFPTGNGTLFVGAYRGFSELVEAGLATRIPRLSIVQAAYCAPLYEMYRRDLEEVPEMETRPTRAEGIAIARPLRGSQILEILRKTGGEVVIASEDEIAQARKEVARQGLYIEPTSAAALAGLDHIKKGREEAVLVPLTGHGLKSKK